MMRTSKRIALLALSILAVSAAAAAPEVQAGDYIRIDSRDRYSNVDTSHLRRSGRPDFGAGAARFVFRGNTPAYRRVRQQQGRVLTDADHNEQAAPASVRKTHRIRQ